MIYMFLADGFEETEAVVPWDILQRGGLDVTTVGVTGEYVTGAHSLMVKSDITIDNVSCDDADMIILPGGMPGTTNLENSDRLRMIIEKAYKSSKFVAAICAAPMVLGKMGILNGKKATCFPGFEQYLDGAELVRCHAVRDGNVITASGAGGAFQFGFELLSCFDEKKAKEVRKSMQYEL